MREDMVRTLLSPRSSLARLTRTARPARRCVQLKPSPDTFCMKNKN
jgi:hypothetical protein